MTTGELHPSGGDDNHILSVQGIQLLISHYERWVGS